MVVVVDVNRPLSRELLLLLPARLAAAVPRPVARFHHHADDQLATLGYAVQGVCALGYGHFSDWWTRSGRSEAACRRWMMVASQFLAAFAILGLAYAHTALPIAILLCLAGAASASLSLNLYAIAQMFAGPRAAGTWIGVQNSFG